MKMEAMPHKIEPKNEIYRPNSGIWSMAYQPYKSNTNPTAKSKTARILKTMLLPFRIPIYIRKRNKSSKKQRKTIMR